MFAKIAKFFIQNGKLTFVLVLITILSGIGSYLIIAKQYNPTIIVPAFEVGIPAPGLSNNEVSNFIVSPLENKIMELEGIDKVYGFSMENYGGVMLKFKVGVDKEKAKIRLTQKLSENLDLKPLGVYNPIIKTIDPDELAQVTFAISYSGSLSEEQSYIYLRQIGNIVKKELKTIENISTIDIVGGFKNNIIIDLDLEKIEVKNVDIMQVYDVLKKNNLNMPAGDFSNISGENTNIKIEAKLDNIEDIKKLIVGNISGNFIYLEDIADIRYGIKRVNKTSTYNNKYSIFLGVGKTIGTNAVFVTDSVVEKINKIKQTLPKDIEINIIQNEGDTARNATNMLLINLAQSIIIVFFVLALYLGKKDAFNTAISIPLTLGLVFLLALIVGENINRITLFALILVLGMLVDNSTVVVENISRHLNERIHTNKTKLEAVLLGVQEVGAGVMLSTISRLLAFGAMFAVGGMMGEYMGPIPQFAIWALILSLIIAFTINPWISYISAKNIETGLNTKNTAKNNGKTPNKSQKNETGLNGESPFKIRKKYLRLMRYFINNEQKSIKRRKIFKFTFWLSLLLIIILPIYFGIFKARMLPKSNQDQIYIWIDAPRGINTIEMKNISDDINNFFFSKNTDNNVNKLNQTVKEVSITSGEAFMADFANLFRGGNSRFGENQLSLRLNLYNPSEYKEKFGTNRLFSEEFTIKLRPYFKNYILRKYPDLEIKLLEDPPGPPVRSTFLTKIKSSADKESIYKFSNKVEKEINKIKVKQSLVDLGNSDSTTYKKLNIILDHDSISKAGLTSEQVSYTLAIAINGMDIDLISNSKSLETTNIILGVKNNQNSSKDLLKSITFTNKSGEKIHLDSIAEIKQDFVGHIINTDSREETLYIYAEMGNNSLIYPMIELIGKYLSDDFIGKDYIIDSWNLYGINYIGVSDGKKYTIEFGGEWELTMDTFRDLGLAMILSLLAIYFLLVGQFASFKVAGIIMITFLLSFYGVFFGFSFLFLLKNEYFSATSMIGIIALGGIVVGNAIILIDYINVLRKNGLTISEALLKAGYVRFAPIILTSLTTVFGAATIVGDPVWSGLAWAIIWGLLVSSILTLIVIPIFYYDSQKKYWYKIQDK